MRKLPIRTTLPLLSLLLGLTLLLPGCPKEDDDGGGGSDGSVSDGGGSDGGGCASDLDCNGGTCDLLTGTCSYPDGGVTDGGDTDGGTGDGGAQICTPNDSRCNQDGVTLEVCAPDGTRWRSAACPSQVPACFAGDCVVCAPGMGDCNGDTAMTCRADGSGWDSEDCAAAGGSCSGGVCLLCPAGATRCADTATLQTCNSTGTAWLDSDCGTTNVCDASSGSCIPISCTTGVVGCQGERLVECNATGDGFDLIEDCAATGATCRTDQCVNLCAEAVQNDSYIGCEYWPVVLSNSALADRFRSDFAVVLANPNVGTTADVAVFAPGSATPVLTAQVAGGTLETLRLPWNALDAVSGGASTSARGAIAYKLTSSVPVTAYQFNPLASNLPSGCTQDSDCPGYTALDPGSGCLAGAAPRSCGYDDYSYTNDASLLLPAHILGDAATGTSGYMAVSPPHEYSSSALSGDYDMPAYVAIVGTQDATTVTFTSAGATAAGGGLSTLDPGGQTTLSLDAGDVVQIATRQYGTPEETSVFLGPTFRRYLEADLTGSVITSDKPIAVYSGADCAYVPYNKQACDHLEQQLFPFSKWGTSYVAAHSEYPNNTSVGDVWRIVAGADATQIVVTPASVHAPVTLARGEFLEITTTQDFVVQSQDLDHPIMVVQYFVGIETVLPLLADPSDKSNVGDPSMVLAIPTQQFRDAYTFTTPDTIARDFVSVVRPTGATVTLDAVPMNTTWSPIAGTSWEVGRIEIQDGTHRLQADQPVGLSVYGFDWSVSYGYPGGLDLRSIVIINPGG
ncbi:MAG: IgGFc-binding protein [Deltaproteobacteria bacterium]|nr:IgGFc-binding protein [Deltaproteobacteria bacterium]